MDEEVVQAEVGELERRGRDERARDVDELEVREVLERFVQREVLVVCNRARTISETSTLSERPLRTHLPPLRQTSFRQLAAQPKPDTS